MQVQLCVVLRCSCVAFSEQMQLCGVLGADAAVWGFRSRCSCVAFLEQMQLGGVLGADAAVWGLGADAAGWGLRSSWVGF